MALFRVSLRLTAPLGTELVSGTLFGQLCWMLRERSGEAALVAWLGEAERLWALSDGFPAGLLPRPMIAPGPPDPDPDPKMADKRKDEKKKGHIRRDGFLAVRGALSAAAMAPHLVRVADRVARFAHNSIDRRTGSTPETAGLHFVDEDWSFAPPSDARAQPLSEGTVEPGGERDIYVRAPDDAAVDIAALFTDLGENGFGRDASLGRGRWSDVSVVRDAAMEATPDGAGPLRLVSLSRGSAETLNALRCKLVAHYGKAGPQVAVGAGVSPFKKPLLLTAPGATFAGDPQARHGAILTHVHPDRPEIVHNALHVVIACREAA